MKVLPVLKSVIPHSVMLAVPVLRAIYKVMKILEFAGTLMNALATMEDVLIDVTILKGVFTALANMDTS